MYEETGVRPEVGKLLYVHQFQFKDSEQLEFFFHIANPSDYLEVDLENSTHGVEEVESIDFMYPKESGILPTFLSEVNLEDQINSDVPVKIVSFEK